MVRFHLHSYGFFDERRTLGPAVWPHFDLLFVLEGELSLTILGEHRLRLARHDAILLYPDTSFQGKAATPTAKAAVQHFALDPSEENDFPVVFGRLRGLREQFDLYHGPHPEEIEQDIDRAIRWAACPQTGLILELRTALLALMLGQLHSGKSEFSTALAPVGKLDAAIAWVRKQAHHSMRVEEMAKHVGLSTSHFRSLFAKRYGISPGTYLRKLRLNEAKRLLIETRQPIKQISDRLGYSDSVSFHHAFRNSAGIAPGEFRRTNATE